MYNFTSKLVNGFCVSKATPEVGAVHLKKFAYKVTPQNQATLNLYIAGSFELTSSSFTQMLEAGQTSLDVALLEYPAGELVTERVMSGPAVRYCVAKVGGGAWLRVRVDVAPEWVPEHNGLLIYSGGDLVEVTQGVALTKFGSAVYCLATA